MGVERGIIGKGILQAFRESNPKQKKQAQMLGSVYDYLVADGFEDPNELQVQRVNKSEDVDFFSPEGIYTHDKFSYDRVRMIATVGAKEEGLTAAEHFLLITFIRNPNVIIDRKDLAVRVRILTGKEVPVANIGSWIYYLRRKIESDPKRPEIIVTKSHAGYMFRDLKRLKETSSLVAENDLRTEYSLYGGRILFYPRRLAVMVDGIERDLTLGENKLFESLVLHGRAIVKYETLIEAVWGKDALFEEDQRVNFENSVKIHIQKVRRKIGDHKTRAGTFGLIKTVSGVGYICLTDPNKPETSDFSTTVFEAQPKTN